MQRAPPQASESAHSLTSASKASQAKAVQVGLGELHRPLGTAGENGPEAGVGRTGGGRHGLHRGCRVTVGPGTTCCSPHTGYTVDFTAQDPQSKAGVLNLLLKCGAMSLGQGQGQEPQGEGLCSWNKEDKERRPIHSHMHFLYISHRCQCVLIESHLLRIFFGIIRNELHGRQRFKKQNKPFFPQTR